ncbi:delta and Notch-like epidermal growth factor-related receptor [Scyliorhinus canicula]|uniref:delta and Notch-like epidermal growth factor-related receptor n=1 Tax=Scyliorhinus canicula TaxID=7830 RepID=UPI0018F6F302|nr:delta and Notch-like epidermal growth factor-related receptor [Scyliorhinus canicula]
MSPLLLLLGTLAALTATHASPLSSCTRQPCLNNGTCVTLPGQLAAYNCTCAPGFAGQHCQDRTDECASNPCHHGNCSSNTDGYVCVCEEGYWGDNCDQPLQSTLAPSWTESMLPWQPEPAATSMLPNATSSSSTWQTTVTLSPWQPEPGHKVANLTWDLKEMINSSNVFCGNNSSNESLDSQPPVVEVPEETALRIKLNGVDTSVAFWEVTEAEFQQCSVSNGKNVTPLHTIGGFILLEEMVSLGSNYFIALVNDSATKAMIALRVNVTVKASICVEQMNNPGELQCSGKGQCITKTSEVTFYCDCEEGHIGLFCEEFDGCHSNQCQNNGTCLDIKQGNNEKNFTCVCSPGYTGERCQSQIDHCVSQPCENGATCMSRATGYSCLCPEGFTGLACEQRIDPCALSPCQNNGTCFAEGTSYSCNCSPAYAGPLCAQLIDFCALNPCSHGICSSVGTSYKCLCAPGYHGLYCEEEYNECLSIPCQNSGTCKDLVNGYECQCPDDYKGKHCDQYKDPCATISCQNGGTCTSQELNTTCICVPGFTGEVCEADINECDSNPCHHGGTCMNQENGYTCHCPHGWVGINCDVHLEWKSDRMAESLNNMPRHSLYIIIGALCVAFVLMLIILIVGICRISRIEYQGSSRPSYEEFYNCRSIDSEFSSAIASIRHARFGKKARPAMYDATPVAYEDYSPDDKPLVTLIKTKDL